MVAWREETRPNAAWAERYGGDYAAAMAFLDKSSREERNKRWIRNGTVAVVFAILVTAAGVTYQQGQLAKASLVAVRLQSDRAKDNFEVAKDVVRNLTVNFSASLGLEKGRTDITTVHDFFWKAKATLDQLAKKNPDDAELLEIQAVVLDKFTDGYSAAGGYYELALRAAKEANALLRRLVEREPENMAWQASLSVNLDKIGELEEHLQDPRSARARYDEALAIDRKLMLRAPASEEHPRQAAIELTNIGDLQLDAGDKEGALELYQEALELRGKLAASFPMLSVYQKELAANLGKSGNVKSRLGDKEGALETFEQALKVHRQLIKSEFDRPSDDDYTNYSLALLDVAPLQQQLGNDSGALANYQQSLQTDNAHARRTLDWGRRRASTPRAIGDLQLKLGDVEAAKKSYADASAVQQQVVEAAGSDLSNAAAKTAYVDDCGAGSWYALLSNQAQQSADLAEAALKLDPSKSWIDVNRAHAYLFLGRYDDAKAIYLKQKDARNAASGRITPDIIRDDFALFRKLGLSTDAMERMAKDLGI